MTGQPCACEIARSGGVVVVIVSLREAGRTLWNGWELVCHGERGDALCWTDCQGYCLLLTPFVAAEQVDRD